MLGVSAHDKRIHCVTVERVRWSSAVDPAKRQIELVCTGERRRPHCHIPQGQSSPLWPQWAAAWPLVPHSRTLERGAADSGKAVAQKCATYGYIFTQRAMYRLQYACSPWLSFLF